MSILDPKTPARTMAAFDGLPAGVRQAIANADFAYDPEEVAARLRRTRARVLAREICARTARRVARSTEYEVVM